MADDGIADRIRGVAREAGRRYARARNAYTEGRRDAAVRLPTDDDGRVRLVCRRHAERRAVALDAESRPACFDADHPDCQGCVEDVRDGVVETW